MTAFAIPASVGSIPAQSPVWDERRNGSATRPVSPTALSDCMTAMARFRRDHPDLAAWIAEGAPHLTEDDHRRRFGCDYRHGGQRRRR